MKQRGSMYLVLQASLLPSLARVSSTPLSLYAPYSHPLYPLYSVFRTRGTFCTPFPGNGPVHLQRARQKLGGKNSRPEVGVNEGMEGVDRGGLGKRGGWCEEEGAVQDWLTLADSG